MKYKRATIRLDLSGVYKFHVEELPYDREDIGETYNAMDLLTSMRIDLMLKH